MCVFVCISAHGSEKSEEEGGGLREAGEGRGGGCRWSSLHWITPVCAASHWPRPTAEGGVRRAGRWMDFGGVEEEEEGRG